MTAKLRHPRIIEIARTEGKVTVDGLAAMLDVTEQTVRRDLAALADAGQLERVHGGAVLPLGTRNMAYAERQRLNHQAKTQIGLAAAKRIPDDICLFLPAGTTSEAVAACLNEHRGLMVVTNNTHVARILGPAPGVRVVLTGGTVREADGAMTGPIVHSSLALFRFDLAVIGAAAIDGRGAVLVDDVDDARIAQDVLHAARGSCLIADASKFARHAPVAATALSDLGCLVTDAPLEPALTLACGQSGTEIVIPR